jgi:purine-binding chemotaxis protein CheW
MTESTQRLIVFRVQGERYALDLRDVAEVMDPPETFPVPWAPGPLTGAMNFHGSLVTLLDLAAFMEIGSRKRDGSVLVLDKRIANLALRIDSVESIILTDGILEEDECDEPLVDRVFTMADGTIRMLSLNRLLEKIEETLRR